jgi:hypothetical protein
VYVYESGHEKCGSRYVEICMLRWWKLISTAGPRAMESSRCTVASDGIFFEPSICRSLIGSEVRFLYSPAHIDYESLNIVHDVYIYD